MGKRTRKISVEDVRSRIAYGVCPACGDYRLVRRFRVHIVGEQHREKRFGGTFLTCDGPAGHKCYHLFDLQHRESTSASAFERPTITSKPVMVRRRRLDK